MILRRIFSWDYLKKLITGSFHGDIDMSVKVSSPGIMIGFVDKIMGSVGRLMIPYPRKGVRNPADAMAYLIESRAHSWSVRRPKNIIIRLYWKDFIKLIVVNSHEQDDLMNKLVALSNAGLFIEFVPTTLRNQAMKELEQNFDSFWGSPPWEITK